MRARSTAQRMRAVLAGRVGSSGPSADDRGARPRASRSGSARGLPMATTAGRSLALGASTP